MKPERVGKDLIEGMGYHGNASYSQPAQIGCMYIGIYVFTYLY